MGGLSAVHYVQFSANARLELHQDLADLVCVHEHTRNNLQITRCWPAHVKRIRTIKRDATTINDNLQLRDENVCNKRN